MKNIKFLLAFCALALSNHSWAQTPPAAWGTWENLPTTHPNYTAPTCCGTTGAHFIINSDEVWDSPLAADEYYVINQTIRVLKGASLTIKSGVALMFTQGTGIIVEVGALLTIEDAGTILTSFCPSGWNGIEVKGDPTASQSLVPNRLQGEVQIMDDATISYARVAIQAGGCAGEGGGVIKAENSIFENNINGITFAQYQGDESASLIEDCRFEINDGFQRFELIYPLPQNPVATSRSEIAWSLLNLATGDASQITINEMDGLQISGCQFYNYFCAGEDGNPRSLTLTGPPPTGLSYPNLLLWAHPDWMGSAIVARESEFTVTGLGDCGSLIRNEFVGWFYGIDAQITNGTDEQIVISSSDFTNNKYSVQLANYDVANIDENTFTIWGGVPNPNDPSMPPATDGIWNNYIVTNENYEEGEGSFNNVGINLIHDFREIYVRGNRFNTDLEFNFGAQTALAYYPDEDIIPEILVIQQNLFHALIENRPSTININPNTDVPIPTPSSSGSIIPTAQEKIGAVTGISIANWTENTSLTNEVFIDCNTFDLYEQGVSMIREKQYLRYDILLAGAANVTMDIQSLEPFNSEPYNEFTTDYEDSESLTGTPYGCKDGNGNTAANYFAYHIESNFTVNYPIHTGTPLSHQPTCSRDLLVNTTTASVAHQICDHEIECGDFTDLGEEAPAPMGGSILEELQVENALHLFPNPATDAIMVDSDMAGTYKVMSLDGRVVIQSSQLHTGQNQLDISQLRTGEYILHFIGDTNTEVHKFVKE